LNGDIMTSCMHDSTMQDYMDMFMSDLQSSDVVQSDSESNMDDSAPDLSMIESVAMSFVVPEEHNDSYMKIGMHNHISCHSC